MIAPYIFTVLFALYCAQDDARQIRMGVTIKHASQWIVRAGVVLLFMVCFVVLTKPTIGQAVLITLACAPLFSMVFRFLLNTMRGRHWNYISPSSLYDWQYLRPFMHPIDRTECVEAWHVYMASMSALRAGRVAYVVEGVAFAVLALV